MHIDIVLDVICPWCFIGKRRLENALAQRPEVTPEISWRPFQLNPDMPPHGMTRQDYLAAKFGGGNHAGRIYQTVGEAGASVGISFAFDRIRRTPSTRDAHRLIRRAEQEGCADLLVESLFRTYFLEGGDTGDRSVLAGLAGEAGMGRAEARRFLDSDVGIAEMLAEDRSARRMGINAVPCFVLDGKYAISGAQEPEFFFPIFDLVRNGAEVAAK